MLSRKDYLEYKKVVRTKNMIRISKAFLVLVLVFLSIILIYNFDLEFTPSVDMNDVVNSEAYLSGPNCGNLSFQDTAVCLNDFTRKYFFYNITDDDLNLNVQDMMEQGGDCKNWAEFYQTYMAFYGFNNSQIVRLFVEKKGDISMYHVYLAVSHKTGYCNMDIRDLECYSYVKKDGEARD